MSAGPERNKEADLQLCLQVFTLQPKQELLSAPDPSLQNPRLQLKQEGENGGDQGSTRLPELFSPILNSSSPG